MTSTMRCKVLMPVVAHAVCVATTIAQEPPRKVSLDLGVAYTNDYYFRGIIQEDDAFIVQQNVDIGLNLAEWEGGGLSATIGMWNSYHDTATGASNSDDFVSKWYESDFYAGVSATVEEWAFGLSYVLYTSPNGAFGSVNEIDLSVGFDDSEYLGAWALSPSATVAFELGENAADGGDTGIYFELGIAPGYTFEETPVGDVTVSVPMTVGLSLHDYYEDSSGDDEVFGYFDIGVEAGVDIPVPDGYGGLSLTAGVHFLILGDHTTDYNSDDEFEAMAVVALTWSF